VAERSETAFKVDLIHSRQGNLFCLESYSRQDRDRRYQQVCYESRGQVRGKLDFIRAVTGEVPHSHYQNIQRLDSEKRRNRVRYVAEPEHPRGAKGTPRRQSVQCKQESAKGKGPTRTSSAVCKHHRPKVHNQ
jgi:hypothetical protein